jgi:hypothetical protein
MFKAGLTVFIVLLFISINTSHAKVRSEAIHDELPSKILSEQRELLIHLPNNYHQNTQLEYPVLYLLDGQRNFQHAVGSLDLLNQSFMAQEMIIVAIKNVHRTRDFTPTYDESYNRWGASGGADKFLDFMQQELIPYVNRKYRTNHFKVLAGHSLGGLFTVYALHSRPQLFQAHFAFSPSLWWHDEVIFKQAESILANANELNSYLYINMANEGGSMFSAFERYTKLLKTHTPKGFKYISELEKQENHGTSALVGQTKAYRFLYSALACPEEIVVQGLPTIKQYYAELSKIHGYQIKPSYRSIRSAGHNALNQNDYTKAIEIFELNVHHYPYIADGYDRLAYALEASGQLDRALNMVDLALKKGSLENVEINAFQHHKAHLLKQIKEPNS